MLDILVFACAAVLAFASMFHFYWALGGRVGTDAAIPQRLDGSRVFQPRPAGTFIVAAALLLMAFLVSNLSSPFRSEMLRIATGSLAIVFLVRALGWFEYVGFFKKVRETKFGRYDSLFYCPLCLFLGAVLAYASLQP
ncbi:MAG: DUF3995 domain-containing protein [Gallionella sp.]